MNIDNRLEAVKIYISLQSSASEIVLDVGEDRVVVVTKNRNYHIEGFIADYKVDIEKVHSNFDTGRNVLTVNLPVSS